MLLAAWAPLASAAAPASWSAAMIAARAQTPPPTNLLSRLEADFPVQWDWLQQDAQGRFDAAAYLAAARRDVALEQGLLSNVCARLPAPAAADFRGQAQTLQTAAAGPDDPRWLALYEQAHRAVRTAFLAPLLARTRQIVFAKHQVFGSHSGIYLITETEGCPTNSSALGLLDLTPEATGGYARVSTLFDAQGGIVRDPALSYDARRLLFAWRQSREDIRTQGRPAPTNGNYQICEMDLTTRAVRPLTTEETYGASFEPCYLPNGDILFSSARIVQHITCGWGDCSNLFLMNRDGKYARRVGFDQTNTAFPTVLPDGRVVYTRRDYNDRGQSAAHALFVMNPDGTTQTELYGNQTGTPNSFQHARGIPGSTKLVCILGGYHTTQGGKLALLDPARGRQKAEGLVQLPEGVAPPCGDKPDDGYGKRGEQYSYPFPFSEREFLVARSERSKEGYKIYFLTADGRREVLAADPQLSCLQPIPVLAQSCPPPRPSSVDYRLDHGTFFVQNVYTGAAAEGIRPGSIKKLRVVEILYKYDTIGAGLGRGPGGAVHTVTTCGHPIGPFDAKRILGEATVYPDGSALFRAPARKPLYFQLLDEKNRVVQTMRSWATLMPGEKFSCLGCHESKNQPPAPAVNRPVQAMRAGVEPLRPFYPTPLGTPSPSSASSSGSAAPGFSFPREVQPILDQYCVRCHNPEGRGRKLVLTAAPLVPDPEAKKQWTPSYVNLTKARPGAHPEVFSLYNKLWARQGPALPDEPNRYVTWWTRFELMRAYPPYRAGSIASGMMQLLEKGHAGVRLPPEAWDKLCAWIDLNIPYCGDYAESNLWTEQERALHAARVAERARNEAIEARNLQAYLAAGQP